MNNEDEEPLPLPRGAWAETLDDGVALVGFCAPPARLPPGLTEAEQQVALEVYDGATNAQIASRRGTSVATVANQLDSIYRKLNVGSRVELIARLR